MLNNPSPGANHAVEYMVSPIPWVTASSLAPGAMVSHTMPNVASTLALNNRSTTGSIALGWSQNGVNGSHRITVQAGENFNGDFRFVTLYLLNLGPATSTYELLVGITGILNNHFPPLSGSGYTGVG